jgi:hypothetical protein
MKEVFSALSYTPEHYLERTEFLGNAKISALKTVKVTTGCVTENRSVDEILKSQVLNCNPNDAEAEDAFFVADLGEVVRQQMQWKELLPRVEPHFGNFLFS